MNNKIYPCLWFDNNGNDAASFYCNVFGDGIITSANNIVTGFTLHGEKFIAINGGPMFKPNPSISIFVLFENTDEVNDAWNKLSDGGTVLMPIDKYPWSERYGWIQDKFGISWQLYAGKMENVGQKFTPLLMFTGVQNGYAENAISFYTSVFPNSTINGIARYEAGEGDVEGRVKHGQFILNNYVFMAMESSGPHAFEFNEAVSIVVECDTQDEIDYYWNILTANGGQESMCGWLKDKYGVSWQIIPTILGSLMSDPDKAPKAVQAFMKMKKFEIDKLLNL